MARRRKQTPRKVVEELLFINKHTCCICNVSHKDIVIHHIDGNTSNNKISNLAVLCLDCHSKVTGRRGLGKSYTPGEVRRCKRSWEQRVLDSRRLHRPRIQYRKELIGQIDLIVCEILACRKNNPRVEELLNMLYEIHLWLGSHEIDDKIIKGLHHLALMSGLGFPRLAAMVAEKLWEMCYHFVGPKDVPMDKRDVTRVLECIDALATLAEFNNEFGHGRKAAEVTAEKTENFLEIGLWYSSKRIVNAAIRMLEKALRACYTDGKLEFQYGRTKLRHSVRNTRKMLVEQQPKWHYQKRHLEQLLII